MPITKRVPMKRTNIKLFQVDLGAACRALKTSSFDGVK